MVTLKFSVIRYYLFLCYLLFSPGHISANIDKGIDDQAKLPYWQYQDQYISIRFVQRLPDQTRGFFMARGFSAEHANLIAKSCVFQTIVQNISDKTRPVQIEYDMTTWQITHNGQTSRLKTREEWATQWENLKVATPARLAFNWGLLPTTQHYQPGDYNWGMATFNLDYGRHFDLTLTWQLAGQQHKVVIPAMQCADDIHPEPEEK